MKKKLMSFLSWVLWLGAAVLIAIVVRTYIIEPIDVIGNSMEPTLSNGDRVWTNKFSAITDSFERGDIVILKVEGEPRLIKRIVGLPGDRIEVREGVLLVNGIAAYEPYLKDEYIYYSVPEETLPEGYCYVLGDNRNNSTDSHKFGAVPLDSILGKAF